MSAGAAKRVRFRRGSKTTAVGRLLRVAPAPFAWWPRQGISLLVALVAFCGIWYLRLKVNTSGVNVTILWMIPVAIVAIEFGRLAGAATGLVAASLAVLWSYTAMDSFNPFDYGIRTAAFVSVGMLVGVLSEYLRAARGLETFVEVSPEAVMLLSSRADIIYANPQAERLFGYGREGLVGQSVQLILPEHPGSESIQQWVAKDSWQANRPKIVEAEGSRSDGTVVPVELSVVSLPTARDPVFATTVRDITVRRDAERKRAEAEEALRLSEREASQRALEQVKSQESERVDKELERIALSDPLTGLASRETFFDRLQVELSRLDGDSQLAVIFIDVDRFKRINDSLGHDAGDQVLRETAKRMRNALHPEDTLARFGGDEFVVACAGLDRPDDAHQIARRLAAAVSAPFMVDGSELFVSVSLGIALTRSSLDSPAALVRSADAAMYRAKDRGTSRWELAPDATREATVERLEIENDLHRARERGELVVYYQPLVALADGRVAGCEALVRWEHPERGLISPAEFLPLAEEAGLIEDLGEFVLGEALEQLCRWRSQTGRDLFMSINLSRAQLVHHELTGLVEDRIKRCGVDPAAVWLEVTEHVAMEDLEISTEILGRLRDLGVKLAIDDFGTGYSSLTHIRSFPIDVLKLDRALTVGLGHDVRDGAIADSVFALASALGLESVAEGIEDTEQIEALAAVGCTYAQGHYFSAARPPEEIVSLLEAGSLLQPSSS